MPSPHKRGMSTNDQIEHHKSSSVVSRLNMSKSRLLQQSSNFKTNSVIAQARDSKEDKRENLNAYIEHFVRLEEKKTEQFSGSLF